MSKNCTPLWRKAHSEVKMLKNWRSGTTFGSTDAEKLHAAVAKSTFGSENVKKLTIRDHFWKYRCWKIVRRCGEKHICKSKCTKHHNLGPHLEVQMSKNCTPLWRKAHSEVKMLKNWRSGTTFGSSDAEKLYAAVAKSTFASQNVKKLTVSEMLKNCTPLWRKAHLQVKMLKNWRSRSTFWSSDVEKMHAAVAKITFGSQNVKKLTVSEHFLKFWCRKIARRCGEKHIWKWKCWKTVVFGALFEVLMSKNCTPLWRKAHLEVKMLKNCGPRSTFRSSDVAKLVR